MEHNVPTLLHYYIWYKYSVSVVLRLPPHWVVLKTLLLCYGTSTVYVILRLPPHCVALTCGSNERDHSVGCSAFPTIGPEERERVNARNICFYIRKEKSVMDRKTRSRTNNKKFRRF